MACQLLGSLVPQGSGGNRENTMRLTNTNEVLLSFNYARKTPIQVYVSADNFLNAVQETLPRMGRVTHVTAVHHPAHFDTRAFYSWTHFTMHADYTICGVEDREEFGRRMVTTRSKDCDVARSYAAEVIAEGCKVTQ